MSPDRLLSHVLGQNIDDAIKDSDWEEEFAQFVPPLSRIHQVVKVKGDVLHYRSVGVLIKEQVFLDITGGHLSSDLLVVDRAVLWQGKPGQVICDPKALLSAHDAKSVRHTDLVLVDAPVTLCREETMAVLCREHSKRTNVRIVVVADARPIDRLDRLHDLTVGHFSAQRLSLSFHVHQIGLFWQLRESVASQVVSVEDLLPLQFVWNAAHVLGQESLFDAGLYLGDDCARVDVEVLSWTLPKSFLH